MHWPASELLIPVRELRPLIGVNICQYSSGNKETLSHTCPRLSHSFTHMNGGPLFPLPSVLQKIDLNGVGNKRRGRKPHNL